MRRDAFPARARRATVSDAALMAPVSPPLPLCAAMYCATFSGMFPNKLRAAESPRPFVCVCPITSANLCGLHTSTRKKCVVGQNNSHYSVNLAKIKRSFKPFSCMRQSSASWLNDRTPVALLPHGHGRTWRALEQESRPALGYSITDCPPPCKAPGKWPLLPLPRQTCRSLQTGKADRRRPACLPSLLYLRRCHSPALSAFS